MKTQEKAQTNRNRDGNKHEETDETEEEDDEDQRDQKGVADWMVVRKAFFFVWRTDDPLTHTKAAKPLAMQNV